jgi:hypothetical protein
MKEAKGVVVMDSRSNNPRMDEIVAKLQGRPDIFEKLNSGDTTAITEMFSHLGANNFASDIQVIRE